MGCPGLRDALRIGSLRSCLPLVCFDHCLNYHPRKRGRNCVAYLSVLALLVALPRVIGREVLQDGALLDGQPAALGGVARKERLA